MVTIYLVPEMRNRQTVNNLFGAKQELQKNLFGSQRVILFIGEFLSEPDPQTY